MSKLRGLFRLRNSFRRQCNETKEQREREYRERLLIPIATERFQQMGYQVTIKSLVMRILHLEKPGVQQA